MWTRKLEGDEERKGRVGEGKEEARERRSGKGGERKERILKNEENKGESISGKYKMIQDKELY